MEYIITEASKWTEGFTYAFPRILAAFSMLPFMSKKYLGFYVRGGVVASVTLLLVPLINQQRIAHHIELHDFVFILTKELFIGLLYGYLIAIPFYIATLTGRIIDLQRGDSISSTYNPMLKSHESTTGKLFNQGLMVVFFSSGYFLYSLEAIYYSYEIWPIHQFIPRLNIEAVSNIASLFQTMFYMGVLLAIPILMVVLMVDTTMGLLNRFIPQLQVFIISFPIKGVLVALILVLYVPLINSLLHDQMNSTNELQLLIKSLI